MQLYLFFPHSQYKQLDWQTPHLLPPRTAHDGHASAILFAMVTMSKIEFDDGKISSIFSRERQAISGKKKYIVGAHTVSIPQYTRKYSQSIPANPTDVTSTTIKLNSQDTAVDSSGPVVGARN
jgi:hypothetical protein